MCFNILFALDAVRLLRQTDCSCIMASKLDSDALAAITLLFRFKSRLDSVHGNLAVYRHDERWCMYVVISQQVRQEPV